MNSSSNTEMDQVFKQLSGIKSVEPDSYFRLYTQTLIKIKRENPLPAFWLKVAAIFIIVVISTEILVLTNNKQTTADTNSPVVIITNNILYHE